MDLIDTQILIWKVGSHNRAKHGQEDMVNRTIRYIDHLQSEKIDIIIPAPALAEYWAGAPSQERHELQIFEMGAEIAPFDLRAAMIAGDLFRELYPIDALASQFNVKRNCIKIDIMIASIAIASLETSRKINRVVTHDHDLFKAIIRNKIKVIDIPDIKPPHPQGNFLDLFE